MDKSAVWNFHCQQINLLLIFLRGTIKCMQIYARYWTAHILLCQLKKLQTFTLEIIPINAIMMIDVLYNVYKQGCARKKNDKLMYSTSLAIISTISHHCFLFPIAIVVSSGMLLQKLIEIIPFGSRSIGLNISMTNLTCELLMAAVKVITLDWKLNRFGFFGWWKNLMGSILSIYEIIELGGRCFHTARFRCN